MTSPNYPDHWPEPVVDSFANVLDERPDLAGAEFSTLVQAMELLARAYALDAVAADAGYVATGSMSQTIVHPATVESRLSRTEAARILGKLVPPNSRGQRLARARHGGAR